MSLILRRRCRIGFPIIHRQCYNRPMLRLLILGLVFFLSADLSAKAEVRFPEPPPENTFFLDAANLLSRAEEQELNTVAFALMYDEKVPMIFVTVPSLAAYGSAEFGIEHYAGALFDHWGIGSQARNYGILVLVAKADRRARIEFGAAYRNRHNQDAEYIMQNLMIPAFKRGAFGSGLIEAAYGLDNLARGLELPKAEMPLFLVAPLVLIALVALGLLIQNLFKTGRTGWAWVVLAFIGIALFFILRTLLSGRGGGGAFGGGSSGGGGASGGW